MGGVGEVSLEVAEGSLSEVDGRSRTSCSCGTTHQARQSLRNSNLAAEWVVASRPPVPIIPEELS